MSQNEIMQPTASNSDSRQFFFIISTIKQVLTIPLLTEEALFYLRGHYFKYFKYLQKFKVVCQPRQLEWGNI